MRMTTDIRSLGDPAEIMQSGWRTVVLKIIKPTITNTFLQHLCSLVLEGSICLDSFYQYSICCSLRNSRLQTQLLSWAPLCAVLSSQHGCFIGLCWQPCLGAEGAGQPFCALLYSQKGAGFFFH